MLSRFARGVALAALAVIIVVVALALVWHVVSVDHAGAVTACLAIMAMAAALLPPGRRPVPLAAVPAGDVSLVLYRTPPESDRPPKEAETLRC